MKSKEIQFKLPWIEFSLFQSRRGSVNCSKEHDDKYNEFRSRKQINFEKQQPKVK